MSREQNRLNKTVRESSSSRKGKSQAPVPDDASSDEMNLVPVVRSPVRQHSRGVTMVEVDDEVGEEENEEHDRLQEALVRRDVRSSS